MDKTSHLLALLKGYFENSLTEEQYEELWSSISDHDDILQIGLEEVWKDSKDAKSPITDEEWDTKMLILQEDYKSYKKKSGLRTIAFKAMGAFLFMLVMYGIYILYWPTPPSQSIVKQSNTINIDTVMPNKLATQLITSNGNKWLIDSQNAGIITQNLHTKILKDSNNSIVFEDLKNQETSTINQYVLITALGHTQKVTLADGTKVLINPMSRLSFPEKFTNKERRVTLYGEAYFEVSKDASMPFVVQSNGQEVRVLGTKFSINAYPDEPFIKTTLFEGSIQVSTKIESVVLNPNQQSLVDKLGHIKVINLNKEATKMQELARDEDKFQFDDMDLGSILRQLEKWYDVKIEYQGNVNEGFGGFISRQESLDNILMILEQTGTLTYKKEGNKIIVNATNSK